VKRVVLTQSSGNVSLARINKDVAKSNSTLHEAVSMEKKLTMIYWKGEKFWLGKLLEHPEIMTQGETL
jgi:hypothetical protein